MQRVVLSACLQFTRVATFAEPVEKTLLLSCAARKRVLLDNYFSSKNMTSDINAGLDDTQVKLLAEQCLLVNEDDQVTGHASKKECHLMENIRKGLLHRAFSIFLFNSKGELLLQKRSDAKITFPGYWANTCCSHPLNIPGETEEKDALGVKRAAQRKLQHELGIPPEQVPLDSFQYISRVHYKAPCDNPQWGEHEIDYILFTQRDVDVHPQPNEVQEYQYVNKVQLQKLLQDARDNSIKVSPWFRLIAENCLEKWWENLDDLDKVKETSITRFV